ISPLVDAPIEVLVGPEVVTGSSRMKAGTAQKMILNMISTTSMIQLGKVFRGFMVDVQPTNQKLIQRAKRIICETTGCTEMEAEHIFQQA
ncbi:N-acetylmuramic acid 6-phosphate etherase, partial [Streptococcus suis]|nr:N-acetylmuramic acid 6-phosphate etherase [Streptococcus suis]